MTCHPISHEMIIIEVEIQIWASSSCSCKVFTLTTKWNFVARSAKYILYTTCVRLTWVCLPTQTSSWPCFTVHVFIYLFAHVAYVMLKACGLKIHSGCKYLHREVTCTIIHSGGDSLHNVSMICGHISSWSWKIMGNYITVIRTKFLCRGYHCQGSVYSSYAPSQWEASLQCNDASHWPGAHLDWSLHCVNSLRPVGHQVGQWTGSSLVEVMACHLFGAMQLVHQPMLTYCQLNLLQQISVKFESKLVRIIFQIYIWNCCMHHSSHFIQT